MKAKKRSRSGPIAALVVVGLLVLYPLSYGPASWLAVHGYIANDKAAVFYRPMHWACERSEIFGHVLLWYVDFWIEQPRDSRGF
jgi:hypothetical protein